jgi:hypothetical protein
MIANAKQVKARRADAQSLAAGEGMAAVGKNFR